MANQSEIPMGIQTLGDNDLYNFTMQQAILKLYPDAVSEHRFINRGKQKFDSRFEKIFRSEIEKFSYLQFTIQELDLFKSMSFIKPWYVDFLRAYRFNPEEITFSINDGVLDLKINGPWYRTILWEVPLMACISEIYFSLEKEDNLWDYSEQEEKLNKKTSALMCAQCSYADFGTRRRRSFETQDFILKKMHKHHWFAGTSNVHLAAKYNVKAIGTMAHQWIQGISALESMNHPNHFMMEKWIEVYGSNLGYSLTDTYGTNSFLKDFNRTFASIFDGVRHDSGDPFAFVDKIVEHYKKLNVDYRSKTIVFSNALTATLASDLKLYCDNIGIKSSFGIGTFFTNDFCTQALNMVIKLWSVNGFPVVKLSDDIGKECGEDKMVQFMNYLHKGL